MLLAAGVPHWPPQETAASTEHGRRRRGSAHAGPRRDAPPDAIGDRHQAYWVKSDTHMNRKHPPTTARVVAAKIMCIIVT
jgi:hypothetical protein